MTKPWTFSELARLRWLDGAGYTILEIAADLGRWPADVRRQLGRKGSS